MQRVTQGKENAFGLVEKALQQTFLTALFKVLVEGATGKGVTRLTVKQAGIVLPDPNKTAPEN